MEPVQGLTYRSEYYKKFEEDFPRKNGINIKKKKKDSGICTSFHESDMLDAPLRIPAWMHQRQVT